MVGVRIVETTAVEQARSKRVVITMLRSMYAVLGKLAKQYESFALLIDGRFEEGRSYSNNIHEPGDYVANCKMAAERFAELMVENGIGKGDYVFVLNGCAYLKKPTKSGQDSDRIRKRVGCEVPEDGYLAFQETLDARL